MDRCPLCGESSLPDIRIPGVQFLDGNLIYNLNLVHSLDQRRNRDDSKLCRFVEVTLRWWPRYVSTERCIFYIWQDDEPDTAESAIRAMAHYIRRKIAPLSIRGKRGSGYKFFLPDEGVLSERTTVELRIQREAHHATYQSS